MQGTRAKDAYEGDQSFAIPKYTFGDVDFKLVIKEQETQEKPLIFPLTA